MLKCVRLPAKVMRSTASGAFNRKCHLQLDVLQWQLLSLSCIIVACMSVR